jgi:hypothetical protein
MRRALLTLGLAISALFTSAAFADDSSIEEINYPMGNDADQAIDEMRAMRQSELNDVYLAAEAGPLPSGDSAGTAVFFAGTVIDPAVQYLASFIWQGKVFDSDEPFLMNKVLGFKAIKAKVFYGESLLDGEESVIIDYKDTSLLFGPVRDEIRIVAPNVYLGRAYLRTWVGSYNVVNFILNFN